MTAQKHLKQLIRARMQKTGERYATARRHLIGTTQTDNSDPTTRWHFPGNVPGTLTSAMRSIEFVNVS